MDVEMNKTIWNSKGGCWEYLPALFGIGKKVQLGSLAVFGNCLAANLGSDMCHNLLFAISPRNRHRFHDALFEN